MKITSKMLKYRTQRIIQMDREEIASDKNAHKLPSCNFFQKPIERYYRDVVRSLAPYLRRNAGV